MTIEAKDKTNPIDSAPHKLTLPFHLGLDPTIEGTADTSPQRMCRRKEGSLLLKMLKDTGSLQVSCTAKIGTSIETKMIEPCMDN
jgi:hypothetical protein